MPLERGVVVGGELREPEELAAALKTFFRKNKLPRNCVRLGISNNRIGVRTFEISGIDDPRQLANAVRFRAQETLADPARRGRARLPHPRRQDRRGRRADVPGAARRRAPGARRALRRRLPQGGAEARRHRPRGVRAAPGAERSRPAARRGRRGRLRLDRPRPLDARRLRRPRLRVHPRARLGRLVARRRARPRARPHPLRCRPDQARRSRSARRARAPASTHATPTAARRAMAAELQTFARELVASLRFYQEQPGSLGIVELLVTGGAAPCGGLGRGARAADRHSRPRRRSPHCASRCRASCARQHGSPARSPLPSDWGSRTDARRQPPPARAQAHAASAWPPSPSSRSSRRSSSSGCSPPATC